MAISQYFIEFMIYSFLGWVYECAYCTIKERKWDNRGFLFGPICPIYGVGATVTVILFGQRPLTRLVALIRGVPYETALLSARELSLWQVFLICAIGSFFLEYGTSYALEKRFRAVWWDYSDMPLNLNGRVCLPATVGFGVAGIIFYRYILPVSNNLHNRLPGFANEIIAMALMAYLAADLALTVESLKQITRRLNAIEEKLNEQMQAAVETVGGAPAAIKAKMQEQTTERVREYAAQLSGFQRRTLKNIKKFSTRFSSAPRRQMAELLKNSALALRKGGEKVRERITKRDDSSDI